MDEEALYLIASPEELRLAVNPNVLSEKDKMIMNKISPSDNPIVIKYFFK